MKDQIRVCGIDDAPFDFGNRDAKATVIGAVVRAPAYLEGVLRFEVGVDGSDATDSIVAAISNSRFQDQIRAVMIDGIALGGFNVVDIRAASERLGIPVVTVTRDRPDMASIEAALSKYFSDWRERLRKITEIPLFSIETEHKPVFVSYSGISERDAKLLVKTTTLEGAIPEPIRMAHIIASGMMRGESKGKA